MDMSILTKLYLPLNVLLMGLFAQAAFSLETTGPAPQNILPFKMYVCLFAPTSPSPSPAPTSPSLALSRWYTQLPIAAGLLAANVMAVM